MASDLAHMHVDDNGMAWYDNTSSEMQLMGENSILGKSLVIYEV